MRERVQIRDTKYGTTILPHFRKADPGAYLQAVKKLLRDDGFAIVVEVTKDYEVGL